jgi:hypothetical protein
VVKDHKTGRARVDNRVADRDSDHRTGNRAREVDSSRVVHRDSDRRTGSKARVGSSQADSKARDAIKIQIVHNEISVRRTGQARIRRRIVDHNQTAISVTS